MQLQGEFSFQTGPATDGYSTWVAARKKTAEILARRLGLPLGYKVEVWLHGDIRLRGTLHLKEEQLLIEEDHIRHLEFTVEKTPFKYREMKSCVRLD